MSCDVGEVTERLEMSSAHSPTLPSLHLRHSSFSNPSVPSPTSHLALQPFCRFIYASHALHQRHLASRPLVRPPLELISRYVTEFYKENVYGVYIIFLFITLKFLSEGDMKTGISVITLSSAGVSQ